MMEFAMLYTAVRRIHRSSVSRSSLTFFRYGSSQAYNLMALIPEMTSDVHLIRASVWLTSSLRSLASFFPTTAPTGIITIVIPSPAKEGPAPRMRDSMSMMDTICRGPDQMMCR